MVSSHWYEAVIEKFGTVENFIDQLCEMQGLNKEDSVSIKQEIAIKQLKIKSIHKDIIRLKQENRNIGDKIKSLYRNIGTNALKLIDCSETAGYTYNDRVMRDRTTIDYLEKLQMINSMLINKHRSKVKSLRSELQELKKELNVLGDIKGEVK